MSASFKPRFSFSSLRVRSMLLVLLTAIPVVGLILYSFHEQRQMAKNEATENALYLVRFASQEEKLLLEATRHFLSGLAWLHEIRSGDPVKCSAFLANLLKQYPLYANLGVIKPDGTQYCSALPITEKVSPVDRRWFQEAIRSRGFSVGDYQFGRISRKPVLVLAYPVLDKKGRVMSILAAPLDLGWFNQVAAKARLPQGSSFSIMDRNGLVLARHPDPDKWVGKTLPERVLLQTVRARRGAGTVEGPDADGGLRLFAFAPLHDEQDGLYLTIGIPQKVAYASANQMLWRYLTVLGFACFLLMVLAWWGSHLLIIRPVRALLNATKLLATGNLSARVGAGNGEGELGQLATSINEMAASLQARQAEAEHAYKTVQEKSRMLDLFFKYALTPVVFLDREFNLIRVNEAYARACRRNVSEFPGHNHFEFYPSDAKGVFEEVVKTKKPFQTLARPFVFPDHPEWGVTYWDWSLVPILDDVGEVELLVFSVNDVTKHKRAEEELSRTTQTLQALIQASPVGINILDTHGKVKLWNPAAERIFGWKEEEILGLPLPIIPEDKQEEFRKSYAAVLQGRPVTELETHRQRKDGSLVDVSISTGPIRDAGGSILGSMGVLTDITERKRAEEQLRLGFRRMTVLHQLNHVMSSTLDSQTVLPLLLDKISLLLPYSATVVALINKATGEIEPVACHNFDELEWKRRWQRKNGLSRIVMETGGPLVVKNLLADPRVANPDLVRKRGLVSFLGVPLLAEGEVIGVMGFNTRYDYEFSSDEIEFLTTLSGQAAVWIHNCHLYEQRKKQAVELEIANKEILLAVKKLKNEIAERMRLGKEVLEIAGKERQRIEQDLHDGLGQELTGIAFLAKGLKEKLGRTSIPESADAGKIAHLVTQAVSHTRSLARGLSPVPVGGNGLMSALEELAASVSTLFGVSCQFRCDQPVLVRDNTVATHLYRIAQEAVDNAIKHGKAKQISIQLSSETSTGILSVTDNGTGFPEMADDNGGLGLRIMRHRAEMIQGSLESRCGKSGGTVVLCSFAFTEARTEGDHDDTITKRG